MPTSFPKTLLKCLEMVTVEKPKGSKPTSPTMLPSREGGLGSKGRALDLSAANETCDERGGGGV
jgi:hypothetical protein